MIHICISSPSQYKWWKCKFCCLLASQIFFSAKYLHNKKLIKVLNIFLCRTEEQGGEKKLVVRKHVCSVTSYEFSYTWKLSVSLTVILIYFVVGVEIEMYLNSSGSSYNYYNKYCSQISVLKVIYLCLQSKLLQQGKLNWIICLTYSIFQFMLMPRLTHQ